MLHAGGIGNAKASTTLRLKHRAFGRRVVHVTGVFDRLEAVAALAAEAGVPMSQYALAWTLAQPAISSLIVGVKKLEQLQSAIAAADIVIPAEHLSKLDAICPPPWHQPDPIRGIL